VEKTKKHHPDGELVTAGYVVVVFICKFCIQRSSRPECNFGYFGPGGLDGMDS
jgi:hypothetical protein